MQLFQRYFSFTKIFFVLQSVFDLKFVISTYRKQNSNEIIMAQIHHILKTLVENPPFLPKNFQLNVIYNYVATRIFKFLNRIMAITN